MGRQHDARNSFTHCSNTEPYILGVLEVGQGEVLVTGKRK